MKRKTADRIAPLLVLNLLVLSLLAPAARAAGEAFRRGDLAAVPAAISDEMVETYCAAGPLDKVRARVEATAERADGLFLTPPTYFISAEELSEYQNRIIDAFGPGA